MVLIIDNYDAFTYNLVDILENTSEEVIVKPDNSTTLDEIKNLRPEAIILTTGKIKNSITKDIIRNFAPNVPILGIGLGHLAICQIYGSKISPSLKISHGKVSYIYHDDNGVYQSMPNPFPATRYDSSLVDKESLPSYLKPVSCNETGEVMGIRHLFYPLETIQFHPESIMSYKGDKIISNFLVLKEQSLNKPAFLRFSK